MKKIVTILGLFMFLFSGSAFAIPRLQLFISGGSYDAGTQTWMTGSSPFTLYVIGAKEALSNVRVSMALDLEESSNPNGVASVDVNGTSYGSWIYGYAPLATAPDWDPGDDLAKHGIFPAWYTEFGAGNFSLVGGVGNTQPDPTYWDPSTQGYLADSKTKGEFKAFTISVTGATSVHFDAYTLHNDGSIDHFAPFSHDAGYGETTIPEPASLLLLGLGSLGLGAYRRFRK